MISRAEIHFMSDSYDELEYLEEDEVQAEFIPGGGVEHFVPGWEEKRFGIPGKETENGIYIGVVRIWGEDRRVDRSLRLAEVSYGDGNAIEGDFEEKFEFYYNGEKFHTNEWSEGDGSWYNCAVQFNEGEMTTLYGYIENLLSNWCYDDINDVWWSWYQDEE